MAAGFRFFPGKAGVGMLISEKVKQAIEILREIKIDCWITFVRESEINRDSVLPFLLNSEVTWPSAIIVTAGGETCAIVGEYDRQTVEDLRVYNQVTGYVQSYRKEIQDYLRRLNPAKIALNYSRSSEICDGLTHGMFLTMREILAEIGLEERIVSAERVISPLRERKTAAEIASIKQAIAVTEEIFAKTARFIRPGVSEKEIAVLMKDEVKKRGLRLAWQEGSCPSVFTGPQTAGAHYAPSDRKVAAGHLVNIDFGVKVNGYCSDMQRTFYVLTEEEKEPPGEVLHGFETIAAAIELTKKAMRPGVIGQDIDKLARNHLAEQGYDEFPHGLGHQVGRFVHDGAALLGPPWEKYGRKVFQKLEAGMVFTIEPRLTVPGKGIVSVEEMVLIGENGSEYLTHPQKQLHLIS